MYKVGGGGAVVGGGGLAYTGAPVLAYALLALGLIVVGLVLYRYSAVRSTE
jgi:hypothetical protein